VQEIGALSQARGTTTWNATDIKLGVVGHPPGSRPLITCDGKCGGAPSTGSIDAVARSNQLTPSNRKNTTFRIFLQTRCPDGAWTIRAYDLAFSSTGAFQPALSNLNGTPVGTYKS
jgi:hypothetical protein